MQTTTTDISAWSPDFGRAFEPDQLVGVLHACCLLAGFRRGDMVVCMC